MLADLIAATDNLRKLEDRRESLIAERTRLATRIDDIDKELTRVNQEGKDQIRAAKQAAEGLKG